MMGAYYLDTQSGHELMDVSCVAVNPVSSTNTDVQSMRSNSPGERMKMGKKNGGSETD